MRHTESTDAPVIHSSAARGGKEKTALARPNNGPC
jgi:hypothetical protein